MSLNFVWTQRGITEQQQHQQQAAAAGDSSGALYIHLITHWIGFYWILLLWMDVYLRDGFLKSNKAYIHAHTHTHTHILQPQIGVEAKMENKSVNAMTVNNLLSYQFYDKSIGSASQGRYYLPAAVAAAATTIIIIIIIIHVAS